VTVSDTEPDATSWQSLVGGRLRRAATPAALIARGAGAAALARARVMRGDTAEDIVSDPRLVGVAEDIARSLGEMKGAAMKIGQALSFVDVSLIPEEYRRALSVLQAEAPPMPYDLVEQVIREELGGPPEKVFSWFSPKPIAAASIGQVHMAHVGDRELVVKVQYPGVAKAVEADLRNAALLSMLARFGQKLLGGLVGDIDIRALIDEVRDRVGDELDYRIEATNQQQFADLYRDDLSINIPEVVPELSTRRVITTEYVDAMRWNAALLEPQECRDRWGETIARFVYVSMYRHGLVNVDTHPGNYLFHDDGRVTFLDFGCVSRFSGPQLIRMRRVLSAMIAGEEDAILDSLVAMGLLRSSDGFDTAVLLEPIRRSFQPIQAPQPFKYTRELVAEVIAESLKLRLGADELRVMQRLDCPPEYVLIGRTNVGLESVLAYLEATVDYRNIFDQVFGDDPNSVVPASSM
jgi:predicted unusual protein kinase regulating ubiquinone biosynthesis (AarF/ABC1/UbiB family)